MVGRKRPERRQLPLWLTIGAGVLSAGAGIATNLWSTEFRRAVETVADGLSGELVWPVLSLLVAGLFGAFATRFLSRRRNPPGLLERHINLGGDIVDTLSDRADDVAGRRLSYLEAKRSSQVLVVLLHGLGLDAADYREYMKESRYHCIALTQFGFNTEEKYNSRYRPISLVTHAQLIGHALKHIRRMAPRKRIVLAGFSFGADMCMLLAEHAPDICREVGIDRVLLLDPNVNRDTTTISSRIALVDTENPVSNLTKVLDHADGIDQFGYLCNYLRKIARKDFDQIKRHAEEMVAHWDVEGCDRFAENVRRLASLCEHVHIVLSMTDGCWFNEIRAACAAIDATDSECVDVDHFGLISTEVLNEKLAALLR